MLQHSLTTTKSRYHVRRVTRHHSLRTISIWSGGSAVALLIVLVVGSYFIDEPLRRHMEAQLNAELHGYAVRVPSLSLHPFGLSLTLGDLTVTQKAHPKPPVAWFPELHASVHWRALLRARLVADFQLSTPHLYINKAQLQQEAADPKPLKDKGWQAALETIYPLKIDRFTIDNGDMMYIDDEPNRPLYISALNLVADNIRNVHSPDHTYPSDVRLDATIFDSGKLHVDGKANFLEEPFAGVDGDVSVRDVDLSYFKPILARMNVRISKGSLGAHGHVEYAPRTQNIHFKQLTVRGVQLDYVHSAQTAADEQARAQQIGRAADQVSHAATAVVHVDDLQIANSTVGFVDESSDPHYRVFLANSNLTMRSLSNQVQDAPASLQLKGQFMGSGSSLVKATFQLATQSPDVDVSVLIEETDLTAMNDLLRAFGNFDVDAGQFSLYSQLRIKNGDISGYLKPIFSDAKVYSVRQDADKPLLHQLYEELVGGVQTLLQNRHREVGTKVDISGRASDPKTSTLEVVVGLLKNAFIKAIGHSFESPQLLSCPLTMALVADEHGPLCTPSTFRANRRPHETSSAAPRSRLCCRASWPSGGRGTSPRRSPGAHQPAE